MSAQAKIFLLAFLLQPYVLLKAESKANLNFHHNRSPAHFSAPQLNVLGMTHQFDRLSNYVEKSPQDEWFASWLTQKSVSARGLASTVNQIDGGSGSATSPNNTYSSNGAHEEANEKWKTHTYQRIRQEYRETPQGPQAITSSRSESIRPDRTLVDAADGYRYYQNLVIQCAPDYQPGDTCLVVGDREDFEIYGLELESSRAHDFSPAQAPLPKVAQSPHSNEMAQSSPLSVKSVAVGVAAPLKREPIVSAGQQRISQVAFQSCQQTYDKALKLCGSSSRRPDRDFVLEKLKIVAPSHYAGYLTYVRQLSEKSDDLIATCRATEEVAQSMTALNVYYENLCANAREHCASECSAARAQSLEVNDISHSTSQEYARICGSDMTSYAASGLFQHSEASRMLASAKDCREKLAKLGPCSEARSWDSQQCHRHCQDPTNASIPACVRYKVMNSNCSNPEFAKQNSYCQQLQSSPEVVKGSHGNDPSTRKFTVPNFDQDRAGSFGSGQVMDAASKTFPSDSTRESKAEAPSNPRNVYVSNTFQGESPKLAPEPSEQRIRNFAMNFAEEFRYFWGRVRPRNSMQKTSQRTGDSYQRALSSQSEEPIFNFAKYVFRTETDARGQKKCYRGSERLLCPEQDIFQAISRKYRSIAPEMNP